MRAPREKRPIPGTAVRCNYFQSADARPLFIVIIKYFLYWCAKCVRVQYIRMTRVPQEWTASNFGTTIPHKLNKLVP